eukprot:c16439_g1_i1.p1 GENE.c16439_g1_i1~~c16439_g1_i1.p1  ORF type:complete len:401 (+),score=119.20 c16439_g1_i1:253-1455(+)
MASQIGSSNFLQNTTDLISLLPTQTTEDLSHFRGFIQNESKVGSTGNLGQLTDSKGNLTQFGSKGNLTQFGSKGNLTQFGSNNQLGSKNSLRRQTAPLVCGNVDVIVQNAIAAVMMKTVADLVIKLKINTAIRQNLETLREEVELTVLQIRHTQGKDILDEVEAALNNLVQQKRRSFVALISSIATNNDIDVQKQAKLLEESTFWPTRFNAAREAIVKIDFEGRDHCTQILVGHQILADHQKKECPFRTIYCPNIGCTNVYSARMAEEHQKLCEFTPVECPLKCSLKIPRNELEDHLNSICEMKTVKCPFEHIGCPETLPKVLLEQHLNEFSHSHLIFCMRTITEQEKIIAKQHKEITELTTAFTEMKNEHKTMAQKLNELEKVVHKESGKHERDFFNLH